MEKQTDSEIVNELLDAIEVARDRLNEVDEMPYCFPEEALDLLHEALNELKAVLKKYQ